MPENIINCQNLACPEPVIRTKRFIEANQPSSLSVLVDNEPARENVTRLLQASGFQVATSSADGIFRLSGTKDLAAAGKNNRTDSPGNRLPDEGTSDDGKILVLINAEFFGSGDDELGVKLMRNFLGTLPELLHQLWRVILLNGGVKLCVKNSPVLEQITALERLGVSILACGTCLEHYGLLQDKAVGETTNMLDVVTSMQLAGKVIRP